MTINPEKNLLCFSHLRWDFVFQRPQHLMTRFAENTDVYFLEEPIYDARDEAFLDIQQRLPRLWVCVPHLPAHTDSIRNLEKMQTLLDSFFTEHPSQDFTFWYYTPMAFEFSRNYKADVVVYDCMDELSAFKFAPRNIGYLEQQLLLRADLVFTGGESLYQAKKHSHANIHAFPSSIDKAHFGASRTALSEPADQASVAGIKLGFYGVIDERFDQELIRDIAAQRPDWQIMLIGPVVKIDPALLPQASNIHYLGPKHYQELPSYLSGWDVALVPFLLNESTRFISPTKTPEYLAAGKPVVSTAIRDVVCPYEKLGYVRIGHDADSFVAAIEAELQRADYEDWLAGVDEFLSDKSWDHTFSAMMGLIRHAARKEKSIALTTGFASAS